MTDGDGIAPRVYAGTYARNGGAGLRPLVHSADGRWSVAHAYTGARNASFGTYAARHDLYYFVDEQDDGVLGVYRPAGEELKCLGRIPSGGAQPCYVALDATETCLVVANYGSGSIAVFRLHEETGLPAGRPIVSANHGAGPVADRQEGPHAHCVCFAPDQRWLYHVDLGTDEILAYPFEPDTGSIGEARIAFRAPPGSGPRHLVFHPARAQALLVSELASTLTLLDVGDPDLAARAVYSTLPQGFSGDSLGGHLTLNRAGDRAYVTNRGHDSIAVFAWNADDGLALLQHVPSGGASPRSLLLLEHQAELLVANEEGDNVVVFGVRADGTLLSPHADLDLSGAAFLLAAASPAYISR